MTSPPAGRVSSTGGRHALAAFGVFALERAGAAVHSGSSERPPGRPRSRGPTCEGQANTLRRKLRRPSVKKTTLKATMAG